MTNTKIGLLMPSRVTLGWMLLLVLELDWVFSLSSLFSRVTILLCDVSKKSVFYCHKFIYVHMIQKDDAYQELLIHCFHHPTSMKNLAKIGQWSGTEGWKQTTIDLDKSLQLKACSSQGVNCIYSAWLTPWAKDHLNCCRSDTWTHKSLSLYKPTFPCSWLHCRVWGIKKVRFGCIWVMNILAHTPGFFDLVGYWRAETSWIWSKARSHSPFLFGYCEFEWVH